MPLEELALHDEVRGWLTTKLHGDIRDKVAGCRGLAKGDCLRWHKILAAKGWSVPHWPPAATRSSATSSPR